MNYYGRMKQKSETKISIRRGMHFLAIVLFCLVLGFSTKSYAYPETPGTVLAESANIRSSADTSSKVLASVKKNMTVSICDEVTGADGKVWYQVFVNADTKGFIRSDLVAKSGSSDTASTTTTTSTSNEDTSETSVTPVDAKAAFVTTDNVRIRKGASTNHGIVGTAKKGMSVTVTGEATGKDSKKWYQISFPYNNETLTGFIRSDFITFESVPASSEISEITGTENGGETPAEGTEPAEGQEEQPQEPVEEPPVEEPKQENVVTLLNASAEPYVAPGFKPIILTMNGEDFNAYINGEFYLLYANYNGEENWYLFDSTRGVYARYPYAVAGVNAETESTGLSIGIVPLVVLIVIVVILVAMIVFLFLRLREFTDEYEDDDDEDDEEEVDEFDEAQERPFTRRQERKPVRPENTGVEQPRERTQRPNTQHPNSQRPAGEQRPVRQGQPGQQVRRTEGGQQRPVRPDGNGQQVRRPVSNNSVKRPQNSPDHPVRRPQPTGGTQAKNFIETGDDGDIEFIDI